MQEPQTNFQHCINRETNPNKTEWLPVEVSEDLFALGRRENSKYAKLLKGNKFGSDKKKRVKIKVKKIFYRSLGKCVLITVLL